MSAHDLIAAAGARMAALERETPRRVTSAERSIASALVAGIREGQRLHRDEQRGEGFRAYRQGVRS